MFKHIVMWKLKDEANGATKEENAVEIRSIIEALKAQIKEIKYIEIGFDVSGSENSYDVVLYSEFDSKSDCEIYIKHPEHQKAAVFVGSVVSERKVVDYDI